MACDERSSLRCCQLLVPISDRPMAGLMEREQFLADAVRDCDAMKGRD